MTLEQTVKKQNQETDVYVERVMDEIFRESALIETEQESRAASDAIAFVRPWKSKKVPLP